jgi:predicted branched-subunit amino acid permease
MEPDETPMSTQGMAGTVRDALGIGIAVAAYGLSYGALAVSTGLGVWWTQALSLLMYGGSSQLALVGVIASGGSGAAASATAVLLGVRNLFYGLALAPVLRLRSGLVLPAAHLVSDESVAMALGPSSQPAARRAYWTTGLVVFACWNVSTLVGALGGSLLADPTALGLDAAPGAAFLALVWPRLRERVHRLVFVAAGVGAAALTPLLSSGLPVVLAASAALLVMLPTARSRSAGGGDSAPSRTGEDARDAGAGAASTPCGSVHEHDEARKPA